jgi:hypothetical protein
LSEPQIDSCLAKKKAQGLKPKYLLWLYGLTKQTAEKFGTGQERRTSGAKESA